MARPRSFDRGDVEETLLDVFWARGYARASMEELTAAAGILRGSLYAAYAGKEAMFRAAATRYVEQLQAALATNKTGLDGVQHVLDTVVRLTVRDPQRRGCLILNAIPEAAAMSAETREQLDAALQSMRALLRARLREAQRDARTMVDLEPLVALLFAASVAIRVLGRAGHDRRFLQQIATGAIEAARSCLARGKE